MRFSEGSGSVSYQTNTATSSAFQARPGIAGANQASEGNVCFCHGHKYAPLVIIRNLQLLFTLCM